MYRLLARNGRRPTWILLVVAYIHVVTEQDESLCEEAGFLDLALQFGRNECKIIRSRVAPACAISTSRNASHVSCTLRPNFFFRPHTNFLGPTSMNSQESASAGLLFITTCSKCSFTVFCKVCRNLLLKIMITREQSIQVFAHMNSVNNCPA